jgi:membrane protease YdiL (CAAX protease family)
MVIKMTETQSQTTESKLSLSLNDLLYCFAIILVMLTAFDLMGNLTYLGIIFGLTYTEADIPILNLFLNLVAQSGVVFAFLILYRLRKIEPEEKTSPKGIHLLTTYSLYALNLTVGFLVILFIEPFLTSLGLTTESPYEGIEPTLTLLENPLFIALFLAVLVVGAAVSEELVFRRTLIPMLERRGLGQAWVLIISSIVFSLRHTPSDLSASLGFAIIHFFSTMFGGLILGFIYLRTRNILWPILLHALVNGVAAISQIAFTIYNDGAGDMTLFLVSGTWALIAIGFGVIVLSYLILQLITKRYDMSKPVWLQIITNFEIKIVKPLNVLVLTVVFIFFSGGIFFVFYIVESILISSVIVEISLVDMLMVLIETGYYVIFLALLCLFVFMKSQPISKPIFVSTVITDDSQVTTPTPFIRRPVYQQSSGKLCKSCGNAIITNAKFCAFCGTLHPVEEEDSASLKKDISYQD